MRQLGTAPGDTQVSGSGPQSDGVPAAELGTVDGSAAAATDMSAKEVDRLRVVQRVLERHVTRMKAGELLGISARQVARLCAAYQLDGAAGLVSRKRGRVGNRRLAADVEAQVVELARRFYQGSGPTLVRDKLAERHGIKLAKETVRKVLSRAGLWSPKTKAEAALPAT